MKKLLMVLSISFGFSVLCLGLKSCDNDIKEQKISDFVDSLTVKFNISEFYNSGNLEVENAIVKFQSVTKDEFYKALEKNKNHIRYFSREKRINEFIDNELIIRSDTMLQIFGNNDVLTFYDTSNTKIQRSEKFFLEGKIGKYFILKRIHFEDSNTFFINSKTLETELSLHGLSVSVHPSLPIIFYCNTLRVTPLDKHQLLIINLQNEQLEIILDIQLDWFTIFSFFDKDEATVYYIHSFFDDYELKSTYSKIEFEL